MKANIFSTAKEIVNQVMRQTMEWEHITANNLSEKGLLSHLC